MPEIATNISTVSHTYHLYPRHLRPFIEEAIVDDVITALTAAVG